MLDSEGFVSAGWVYDLMLHSFLVENKRKFLIKAKVYTQCTIVFSYIQQLLHTSGKSLPANKCYTFVAMGNSYGGWIS